MTAIITDALKRLMLDNIFNDVADAASSYYIGIGRSQDWDSTDTPPNPSNTIRDLRDFRVSMQAIKTAEDVSYVIPRHNWSAGTRYSAYDDALVGYPTNSYYIITDEQVVYMCIQQGRNAAGASVTSTVKPTGTLTYPFTTADGYVWRYMYTIGALRQQSLFRLTICQSSIFYLQILIPLHLKLNKKLFRIRRSLARLLMLE